MGHTPVNAPLHALNFLLLGIVACALLVFLDSSVCRYHSVSVADSDEEIRREVAGVVRGADALFFPYASVRKSLCRADSSLETVSFRPAVAGDLALCVIPKRREALVLLECKGRTLGLDKDGIAFLPRGPVTKARVIEFSTPVHFLPGEPVPAAFQEMVRGLLPILASVHPIEFTRIILDPAREWRFFTREGVIVRAGPSEGLVSRLRLLPPLLRVIQKEKYRSALVDLRSDTLPVIRVSPK